MTKAAYQVEPNAQGQGEADKDGATASDGDSPSQIAPPHEEPGSPSGTDPSGGDSPVRKRSTHSIIKGTSGRVSRTDRVGNEIGATEPGQRKSHSISFRDEIEPGTPVAE